MNLDTRTGTNDGRSQRATGSPPPVTLPPVLKHSDAPWIVDEINTPNGVAYQISHLWDETEIEETEAGPKEYVHTHTDEIAQVCMDYHDPAIPLGNARLMAGALDMYGALKAMIAEDDRLASAGDCFTNIGELIQHARKVVAEIEGRAS